MRKNLYSNKIFNYVLAVFSALNVIDNVYVLVQDFEFLNILTLRVFLFGTALFSTLSFFIERLGKEFYSRLFIVANFIALALSVYNRFLVDVTMYSFTRIELISNPNLHIRFIVGLLLFYLSIRFSRTTQIQRQSDYGMMIMIAGFYYSILKLTTIFDQTATEFSFLTFMYEFILALMMIFIGNKLRLSKLKFRTALILFIILAIIS